MLYFNTSSKLFFKVWEKRSGKSKEFKSSFACGAPKGQEGASDLPFSLSLKRLKRAWYAPLCLVATPPSSHQVQVPCTKIVKNQVICYKAITHNSFNKCKYIVKKTYAKRFMSRHSYRITRPLLNCSRVTITSVCFCTKIPVYPDKSNLKLKYSRNRIRRQIIPSIKFFFNPQIENTIFKFSELLSKQLLVNQFNNY